MFRKVMMLMSMYGSIPCIPFRKELFLIDEGYATIKDAAAARVNQANKDVEAELKKKRPDVEIWRSLPCMTKKSKIPFERVKSIVSESGNQNVGKEFSRSDVDEETAEKGFLASGVIHSVVKKRNHMGVQHFKLVNASGRCNFIPCKMLMSTAKSNVFKVYNSIINILLFR